MRPDLEVYIRGCQHFSLPQSGSSRKKLQIEVEDFKILFKSEKITWSRVFVNFEMRGGAGVQKRHETYQYISQRSEFFQIPLNVRCENRLPGGLRYLKKRNFSIHFQS